MTAMNINFKQKPEDALKYFRAKGLSAQYSHLDNTPADHSRDFMVSKMMDLDLLSDVRNAVDDALNHGLAFDDFRKHLTEVLQEKGWWGKQEMADPLTGNSREVQLGSPRRLKTIFDVNLSTAYAAGYWKKIVDNADYAPYLMYDAVDDDRTRPLHHSWDNKILRFDHPWWQTHYPPNGWLCRCSVIALNKDDLEEMGREVDPDPVIETREWTNPRTGSVEKIPVGIDPGWAHNVGENYTQQLDKQFAEKVAVAPARLGAATFDNAPNTMLDALNTQWKTFLDESEVSSARGARAVVGYLQGDVLDSLAAVNVVPKTAGIAIEDHEVLNAKATLQNLPELLAYPQAILLENNSGRLVYIISAAQSDTEKLALTVSSTNIDGALANATFTDFKNVVAAFKNGSLTLIRGSL